MFTLSPKYVPAVSPFLQGPGSSILALGLGTQNLHQGISKAGESLSG